MPYEQSPKPIRFARDAFGLSDTEKLNYQLADERFRALLNDDTTHVHRILMDANSFGEYLFVTLSCEVAGQHYGLTVYGLGYHHRREQWITDMWYWHEHHRLDALFQNNLSKTFVLEQLAARRELVAAQKTSQKTSEDALLFRLLANLTDDDGAATDIDDMGWYFLGLE